MADYGRILAHLYPGMEFTLRDTKDLRTLVWHSKPPADFNPDHLKRDAATLHEQTRTVLEAKQIIDDADREQRHQEEIDRRSAG